MWCVFAILGLLTFIYYGVYAVILLISDGDVALLLAKIFGKPAESLKGKVIWITGASSGIGEKLAVECAKYGAKLILSARRQTELERVKSECLRASSNQLTDENILILPLDITKTGTHQAAFDLALQHFGCLDILVNNAGRSQRALWENIDIQVDRQLFELNVFGVINLTRVAVQYFLKRGEGHVAVTSSLAGIFGAPFSGSYTGSKHAIHGYYNSLRTEKYGKRLAVTIFCPGPTFTNFLQESFTENPGEKFGETVEANDKRMTSERCAQLFAIGLANKLDEMWAANRPILLLTYMAVNFPNLRKLAMGIIGSENLLKLRDSRISIKIDRNDTQTQPRT